MSERRGRERRGEDGEKGRENKYVGKNSGLM